MICTSFLGILSFCVVCSWCGEDFVSLGRHAWRCKSKLNRNKGGGEYVSFAEHDTLPIGIHIRSNAAVVKSAKARED